MDQQRITQMALGTIPATFVLKNARIVNTFSGTIEAGDIAIHDGRIVGIGTYHGVEEFDVRGDFVAPGFIDAHVHIESSMLAPGQFARLVVPCGTTTVIADPHEIANVAGVAGIRFMIEAAKHVPLTVKMMIPSCVPSTRFETSGARIDADIVKQIRDELPVFGLGEVMDYHGVLGDDSDILAKIQTMQDRPIDGHAPMVSGKALNAYVLAGIMTDHEASLASELEEKVNRGMYVLLREGSATRNVSELSKAVTDGNFHRLMFCTDDKHPCDIRKEGHIDYCIKLAIRAGISPIRAIQMATINPAVAYGLKGLGGIAPGYQADLVVLSDLTNPHPQLVFQKGVLVAKADVPFFEVPTVDSTHLHNSVKIDVLKTHFTMHLSKDLVNVIGLIENNVTTHRLIRNVKVVDGIYVQETRSDLLKLAIVERHFSTGNVGLALISGYGLHGGAIGMTIAHDSHNLVLLGDSDHDMRLAMEKIIAIGGGIVVVKNGRVMDWLALEIGGIMTANDPEYVNQKVGILTGLVREMGVKPTIVDPFLGLAFLSLPVIPSLKCTDYGLFDVDLFRIIPNETQNN